MFCGTSKPPWHFGEMTVVDLDDILLIEHSVHPFAWTAKQFQDAMNAGYACDTCRTDIESPVIAYAISMLVVDEIHLLNFTVHPHWQGKGVARCLFDRMIRRARQQDIHAILLEVRQSNQHAQAVYTHFGFIEIGQRRGYYQAQPAEKGEHEDAIVMCLTLS